MRRCILGVVVALFGFGPANAALDPELTQPYHLRVALRVAPHRQLTREFHDQLRRELGDSLQAAFGALAEIQMLDLGRPDVVASDPLFKFVEAKGIEKALDGPLPTGRGKTHFIFVDFVDGEYLVEARQHDGSTGLASVAVRRQTTTDRYLVARTAALLVSQDFGLVGTVVKLTGQRANVALKGGKLGVPLTPWVKKGEVFAVVALKADRRGLLAERVPWCLLRVVQEPREGDCTCEVFNRHEYSRDGRPLPPEGEIAGFRCLKLGTTTAAPRLRFFNEATRAPASGLTVSASAYNFEDGGQDTQATRADGLVEFQKPFENVAFVVVRSAGGIVARLPVEIIGNQTVPCLVGVTKEREALGQLTLQYYRWLRHIGDEMLALNALVKELNVTGDQARDVAMKKARAGLDNLRAGVEALRDEQRTLKEAAGNVRLDYAEGEKRLQDLVQGQDKLGAFIKNLEEVVRQENDPKRKEWKALALQANQLEEQAEFDQALQIYERILKEGSDDAQVKQRLERLRRDWVTTKDDAHRSARRFIHETWPKPKDPTQLQSELAEAKKAFAVCQAKGDKLAPVKLLIVNGQHADKLVKDLEGLKQENEDDTVRLAKTIDEVASELKKFQEEVIKFVK